MAKKLKFIFFLLFFIIIMASPAYANMGEFIRIGLNSPTGSININADSLNVFFALNGRFEYMGRIDGAGVFSISADNSFYVFIEDVGGYSSAFESARNRGAIAVLLDSGRWGIYAGPFADRAAAQNHASVSGGAVVEPSGRRLALNTGGNIVALFENHSLTPLFADSRGGMININGSDYRGFLDAHRTGNNVTAVNVVNLEDYLYSVVPSEMPAGWHIEALKAQAVAARSYAHTTLGSHAEQGFDLCATEHCQVYWGMSREVESSTEAVRYTRGIVALFDGEIINAVYSSSSGGITENSENVWSAASPYLRSRSDVYDTTGREWTRTFALSELSRIAAANNANIGDITSVTITEITEAGRVLRLTLSGTAGNITLEREGIRTFFAPSSGGSLYSRNFRIGSFALTVGGVEIAGGNFEGRLFLLGRDSAAQREVNSLMVLNGNNEIELIESGNLNVQAASGVQMLRAAAAPGTGLPDVRTVQISGGLSSSGSSVTFVGRGWGHGVGMSQHGARGMAEAGYTFREILMHYYTGITLDTR